MIEPDSKNPSQPGDLEVTVRHLREQNAKLLELLRTKGILAEPSSNQNGKSPDINPNHCLQQAEPLNIAFDHSDVTNSTTTINSINQAQHQSVNSYGSISQQSYIGQTNPGNQSNVMPNFNAVIQGSAQPFIQNNSNTLVQNNTNMIQPINLVNFNNANLDSIQSFYTSQNSIAYPAQSSTPSTTTTTTTSTASYFPMSNSNTNNSIGKEQPLPSNAHSILSSVTSESIQNQLILRPKASSLYPHQELVPVIPKIRPEQYDCINRQYSSSSSVSSSAPVSNETSNILDGDSNDSKQKHPRPIRPKPSSRTNSLKVHHSVIGNENKISNSTNNLFNSYSSPSSSYATNITSSPTVSLIPSSSCSSPSSSTGFMTHSGAVVDPQIDLTTSILHSSSIEMSIPPTNNILSSSCSSTTGTSTANKKTSKKSLRNGKKNSSSSSSLINVSNNQSPVPIAPNLGRPLAPAPMNVQRSGTANNPINKRSNNNKKLTKRQSKTLVQCHSESILQETSSPSNSFADSISGFLENFNQELLESNILSQTNDMTSTSTTPLTATTTITTSNLLSDETSSIISSNTNMIRSLDSIDVRHLVNGAMQRQDSYQSGCGSTTNMEEFHERIEQQNILTSSVPNDLHVPHNLNIDTEQISNFMSEEDLRLVEMNFDETTFLKQLDLEDVGLKLNNNSTEQNIFSNLLTATDTTLNELSLTQSHLNDITLQFNSSTTQTTTAASSQPVPPPSALYPGSSLINNNVFTTVVPLGTQQQTAYTSSNYTTITNMSCVIPEEGVQLTARHIEPRQIATYESTKYQDILDDLVMVTDQDALTHAQAAAANDPSIVTTDFTFALIEATNEIMKDSNMETIEAATQAFNDLQYLFPIEQNNQEQPVLQSGQDGEQQQQQEQQQAQEQEQRRETIVLQIEQNSNECLTNIQEQESAILVDNIPSEMIVNVELTKTVLDDSIIGSAITDLSSLLQLETVGSTQPLQNVSVTSQSPIHTVIQEAPVEIDEPPAILTNDASPKATTITTMSTELITPVRPTCTFNHIPSSQQIEREVIEIDYDALLPPEIPQKQTQLSSPVHETSISFASASNPTTLLTDAALPLNSTDETTSSTHKPSIVFEPILSPMERASPEKTLADEIVIESGCVTQFDGQASESTYQNIDFDDLINDKPRDPYDLVEEHAQASMSVDLATNENDQSMEDTAMSTESLKAAPTLEHTYYRYLEKYQLKVKREQKLSSQKNPEQSLPIPTVKLKLKCIFPQKSHKKNKKHKSHSKSPKRKSASPHSLSPIKLSTPVAETAATTSSVDIKQDDSLPQVERPRLKITIRTKLPPPPSPVPVVELEPRSQLQLPGQAEAETEPELEHKIPTLVIPTNVVEQGKQEQKKSKKMKKKKVPSTSVTQQTKKKNVADEPPETEYAGLTRFERPLAQRYHQHPTPTLTPDEMMTKHEVESPSPASMPPIDTNTNGTTHIPHSGFLIDEQTPPSSITSVEHRNSPPPLLSAQNKPEKLKLSYQHLLPYDHQPDQQSNNTFITPPPEIDFHSHQQKPTNYDHFYPHSTSPQKKKQFQRKSSVTSSTSSKSLSTNEYAIDTEALEPVSPTPISMSSSSSMTMIPKPKSSQNPSSCSSTTSPALSMVSSNYIDHSSNYFDHHGQKPTKDHHSSSKKMPSSSRSSKTNLSHPYPTSRSLSNHSYRAPQEASMIPPILPPTMPTAPSSLHIDPYAGSYHHFASRAPPSSFFNFPFPHPFLNPHHTPATSHFPHPSMKYHHPQHHPHTSHSYPTHHQPTFPYHPHLPRQQQYHNQNYMTSRDHHPFDR